MNSHKKPRKERALAARYVLKMDSIIIKGLRVHANHGVFAEEKEKGQLFILDMTLGIDLSAAAQSDDLYDTVNYDEICRAARDAMREHTCDLIECAAAIVMEEIFNEFPPIMSIDLTLKKPEAPLCCEVDYAAVRFYRERRAAGNHV